MIRTFSPIDTTELQDELPDIKWTCPRCKKENEITEDSFVILELLKGCCEACPGCNYVHEWKVKFTDDDIKLKLFERRMKCQL